MLCVAAAEFFGPIPQFHQGHERVSIQRNDSNTGVSFCTFTADAYRHCRPIDRAPPKAAQFATSARRIERQYGGAVGNLPFVLAAGDFK